MLGSRRGGHAARYMAHPPHGALRAIVGAPAVVDGAAAVINRAAIVRAAIVIVIIGAAGRRNRKTRADNTSKSRCRRRTASAAVITEPGTEVIRAAYRGSTHTTLSCHPTPLQ